VDVSEFYQEADMVIGSGRTAVEGMAYRKPVIVAGLRGLGGIITPENYPRFKKIMFSGRFNGALHEGIPPAGLMASILAAQMKEEMDDIISSNFKNVCKDFSRSKIANRFERILNKIVMLHGLVENDESILSLKPVRCSNCEIAKNNNAGIETIIRRSTGQILGYLDVAGRKLFESCDGKHSLRECIPKAMDHHNKYVADFIATMRNLWYQKIITFK
jgi:hypothetical protein